MEGPRAFAAYLDAEQYHPRSDAHSNALCRGVLRDLLDRCEPLAEKAARGELVAQLNRTVTVNYQRWNIDLALGPPPDAPAPSRTELVATAPAPQIGDPLHYATMIHRICRAYRSRWE